MNEYDVIVIGAGPGGIAAESRVALSVAGGLCPGCCRRSAPQGHRVPGPKVWLSGW